jgi:hypothetical protein
MKRRYVTTLIVETDRDPAGWSLDQFANAASIDCAHLAEERRIHDRSPKPTCDCAYGRWRQEHWGETGMGTIFGSPGGEMTASASTFGGSRFSGPICEACAKVPA